MSNYSDDLKTAEATMAKLGYAASLREAMHTIGGELNQPEFFWWLDDRFPGELEILQTGAAAGLNPWRNYCAAFQAYGLMWARETNKDSRELYIQAMRSDAQFATRRTEMARPGVLGVEMVNGLYDA